MRKGGTERKTGDRKQATALEPLVLKTLGYFLYLLFQIFKILRGIDIKKTEGVVNFNR